MMKTIIAALIIMGLLGSCVGNNKKTIRDIDSTNSPYLYEPNISTLTGTLKEENFWGPPNFGEDTTNDKKETYLILYLDKPINIIGDSSDGYNNQRNNVKKIQLVTNDDFTDFIGKQVFAKGTLFGAHTGHHHTEVLLMTDSIKLETN